MKKFIILATVSLFFSSWAQAAEPSNASTASKLLNLEKKIEEIKKSQKECLEVQEKIIADIKNLKIIVNKR